MARYRHGEISKRAVVRRSEVWLGRAAVQRRTDVGLTRGWGATMAELAPRFAPESVRVTVLAESGGAMWSMSFAPGDSPGVGNHDVVGWHRASTQA